MSLGDSLTRKRFGGHGILLLPLLAILLLVPLCRHRDLDHPLAGSERFELCPLLPPAPLPLGHPRARPEPNPGMVSCAFVDDRDQRVLTVSLQSTRALSLQAREAADMERVFAMWKQEVGATYGNWRDLPGDWRHAGAWRQAENENLVFEDGGVLVVLGSPKLDANRLALYAAELQRALRKPAG